MSSCESLADRQQYMTSFNEELDAFKNRVRALAKKRLDEAKRQIEEVRHYLETTVCVNE